jgi:NAD(P)-dependent dehydrogenase (short-subunit alcohol dehydrogenase family)
MTVAGKTIAITGAARGLGQEFARHLAAAGADLVVGDVNDCGGTVALVEAAGGTAVATRLDVTDAASAQAMVDAGLAAFGRLDGLVNNAALYGALHGGRFEAIAEDEWDACMAVNVKGIWNCCKAAVPAMRKTGGSIVNIASLAATYGMPYGLHYTASKAAVIGLTRGLARELGRDGIRVNALAPSAVLT